MKKLLVPVDFSRQSIDAFRMALDITALSGGSVRLLHVISFPVLHDSPLMSTTPFRKQLLNDLKEVAVEKFKRLESEFNTREIRVETEVISGRVHPAIMDCIVVKHIDLVIMGTKGTEGFKEWIVGSNTEKIVRTSPVPVIAVKKYGPVSGIRSIVFPTDMNAGHHEDLIKKITALQDFFQAKLHIICVNTPAVYRPEMEIRKKIGDFARKFSLKNYTINVFSHSNEESGILEFSKQTNADLIAIATHGFTGIARVLNGSVAEDVVNHARFPVWTYCTKSATQLLAQKKNHD